MDPEATVNEIIQLATEQKLYPEGSAAWSELSEEISERSEALSEWLANGGYVPRNLLDPQKYM